MNIIKKTGITNTTSLPNRKIEYLVIHYTAGKTSNIGSAMAICNWFSKDQAQASADFAVDDKEIVQYNPDIKNRYCWAVGGNKYPNPTTSEGAKLYGKATNQNCINIEICSSKINKNTMSAEDTDWYFTDVVIDNAIKLARYLMKEYKIDINHVIMHHHITGKICPNPFCVNESRLQKWYDFKKRLSDENTNATVVDVCNIFSDMNTWSKSVCKLKKSDRITFEKDRENGWSKVSYNGKSGYLKNTKFILDTEEELSHYPYREMIEDGCMFREREKYSTAICLLTEGKKFKLLGKDKEWVYGLYGNSKGYIPKIKTNVK